jgi:hypothetical protein
VVATTATPAEDDADATAWAAVVGAGDDAIATLETRIELLGGDDWTATVEDFVPAGGDIGAPPDALEQLGLAGRDCEIVVSSVGNPPEHATFLRQASSACTTVVSRRAATGYATDVVLEAVAGQAGGTRVTSSPEMLAQLADMEEEWRQTVEDLEAVPTEDVPNAAAWDGVLAAAGERADAAAARRQTLADDDAAAIGRMFTPGATYEHPGLGDLDVLGLDRRDCRSSNPDRTRRAAPDVARRAGHGYGRACRRSCRTRTSRHRPPRWTIVVSASSGSRRCRSCGR